MRSIRHLRAAALVALAALGTACSDSSTGPSIVQPAELSQVLAELQPSSLAPLNSQISAAPVTGLSAPVPSTCSYDSATKSFVCPNVSVSGITVSRSFTLLDASGNAQTAFDRTTTAAVRMKTSFAGDVTSGGTTMHIEQLQEFTLSGLLTGVHTLDGISVGTANGTVSSGTTTTPITSKLTTTITSLELPKTSAGQNYPKGLITAINETTVGALPKVITNASIIFDGTSKAVVSVTVNGVTTKHTVDLSA